MSAFANSGRSIQSNQRDFRVRFRPIAVIQTLSISANYSAIQPTPVVLPPSGFIAGLYARTDNRRGVWKAADGTEATINGATALTVELNDTEQDELNKIGVNCLRRFGDTSIVCWGSGTVYSDPEFKYVPVRRTALLLRRSIYDSIQWAVFEARANLVNNLKATALYLSKSSARTKPQSISLRCHAPTRNSHSQTRVRCSASGNENVTKVSGSDKVSSSFSGRFVVITTGQLYSFIFCKR